MARRRVTPTAPTQTPAAGTTARHDIVVEMETAFLDYSMSVITQRALPDARDGLKPVQRRILQTMRDQSLTPTRPYKKSAAVVGDALAKYHPHGDSSVYDAMVRLAQPFVMNEPLVDGQGNWGSTDGDNAAAYRYTEARMTEVAALMLADIEKQTVDFRPNFDGSRDEAIVLPAGVPNLLLNGSEGIAVGMATKIPPHNLGELAAAIDVLCENPQADDRAVLSKVKGPDFPTGGLLLQGPELRELYRVGRAKMTLRARIAMEKAPSGRTALVATEVPYGVVKSNVLERIAALVKEGAEAPGCGVPWGEVVADLRDESDQDGMRVVIELHPRANVRRALAALYKRTDLQTTYGAQMLALVDGEPRQLGLREALEVWIRHRLDVVRRRAQFDLDVAERRIHIVEGLLIAQDAIDTVVKIIRGAADREAAREGLMKRLKLTAVQTDAILAMRLAALTRLDVTELRDERRTLEATIKELRRILASEEVRRGVVRDELRAVVQGRRRARRTEIVSPEGDADESDADDAGPAVHMQESAAEVMLLADGTLRVAPEGAKGARGGVTWSMVVRSTEHGVVLTSRGRALPVHTSRLVPTPGRRGVPASEIVQGLEDGERILSFLPPEAQSAEGRDLVFVLRNGLVKRLAASEAANPRATGLTVTTLQDGDEIVDILLLDESDDLLLATSHGQALRTAVAGIPRQGRAARGVAGIRVPDGERVVGTTPVRGPVLLLTTTGLARRTPETEFPTQGRGGQGVQILKPGGRSGSVQWAGAVAHDEALRVVVGGSELVLAAKEVPAGGRAIVPKPLQGVAGAGAISAVGVVVAE